MTATFYIVNSTGQRKPLYTQPVGHTDRAIVTWTTALIERWEDKGWYVKAEEGDVISMHRGLNDGSLLVVLG